MEISNVKLATKRSQTSVIKQQITQTKALRIFQTCLKHYHHLLKMIHFILLFLFLYFTKPLSLSFRLFGNILADELVVGVLVALVPLVVPIPLMLLGLFTSAIQALVFATLAGAYIGEALEDHH